MRHPPVIGPGATIWLLLLWTATAGAQTTGRIEGTVVDDSGAALPGVAVEVGSPAMQGTNATATDAAGTFRFVFLPPGSYTVRCSLAGFSPLEQGDITVPLGRTATLRITLQPSFTEEVTVTGAPPAIDMRSPEVGANVEREAFLSLPLKRDYISIVQVAPGTTTDRSGTVVYGSTGLENNYIVDGINISDVLLNLPGRALNLEFVEELQVRTGGYAAEFGRATGGVVNVITRSGGNDYHGDVFGYYFSDALQTGPKQEVEAYKQMYAGSYTEDAFEEADLGFDVGGYISKDRLWFFAAYDRVARDQDLRVAKDFSASGGPPAGKIYVQDVAQDIWSAKLTWRVGNGHSLIASAFGDPGTLEGPIYSLNGTESTFLGVYDNGGNTAMARYEGVLVDSLVLDAQLSAYRWSGGPTGPGTAEPVVVDYTTPMYFATGVAFKSGGYGGVFNEDDFRDAARVNAALFLGGPGGGHEVKAGAEVERARIEEDDYYSGGQGLIRRCARGYLTADGCPDEWVYWGHVVYLGGVPPGGALDPDLASYVVAVSPFSPRSANHAAYLQDTWRVAPAFTVNVGVRWERQRFYDTGDALALELADEWAPRIGAVWDARGKGAVKAFGSWGRFYESAPLMLTNSLNQTFAGNIYNRDPDSLACDPAVSASPLYRRCLLFAGAPTPVDPAGVQGGYIDEAVLGAELTAAPDLIVGAKLVYRDLSRIVEDARGPEGFYLGNPGYGALTELPDLLTQSWYLPAPRPKRTFRGFELTARKRFSHDWQATASYLWSELEGNYDGAYFPDGNQWTPNISAIYDYADFTVHNDGYLSNDRRHQAKVTATYTFPFRLTAGASAYYRSGTPISALGMSSYGNILYLSQRGAWGRTDAEYEADLHLGYPIRLGNAEVNLLLDVFNLLDRQGETSRDQRYNLEWTLDVIDPATGAELPPIAPGTPCAAAGPPEYAAYCNPGFNTTNAWQDPRSVRIGVRVTF